MQTALDELSRRNLARTGPGAPAAIGLRAAADHPATASGGAAGSCMCRRRSRMLPLARLVFRLTFWLPNLAARSLRGARWGSRRRGFCRRVGCRGAGALL